MKAYHQPSYSNPPYFDVVVVGMGIAGLVAAHAAARINHNVLLIEKRTQKESAARNQTVILNAESKRSLLNMIEKGSVLNDKDIKFLDSLTYSSGIKISAIQRYVLNRINQLNKNCNLKYNTTLEDVILANGRAEIITNNEKQSISFNHLVAADGAQSYTLHLVNRHLNEKDQIRQKTPFGMKHLEQEYHLGAQVTLSRVDNQRLNIPKIDFTAGFLHDKLPPQRRGSHLLYFLRFDKKSYKRSNKKTIKVGYISEIPKTIYDQYQHLQNKIQGAEESLKMILKQIEIQENLVPTSTAETENKKDKITYLNIMQKNTETHLALLKENKNDIVSSYVKRAAAHYLNVDAKELKIELADENKLNKNKLKILTFRGGSQKAEKAAIVVNGHGFYQAGDANFKPQYPAGHGANDGIEMGVEFATLPFTDQRKLNEHITGYNKIAAKNSLFVSKRMRLLGWFKKICFLRGKVATLLESGVTELEQESRVNLHTCSSVEEKIKACIDSIDDFLALDTFMTKHPAIVKQFRFYILEKLNSMKENQVLYNNYDLETHKKWVKKLKKYDTQLIELARHHPNRFDKAGRTPLFYAVEQSDMATIQTILNAGADPNCADKYDTIFRVDRVLSDFSMLQTLLQGGTDPFKKTFDTQSLFDVILPQTTPKANRIIGEILAAYSYPKIKKIAITRIPTDQNTQNQVIGHIKKLSQHDVFELLIKIYSEDDIRPLDMNTRLTRLIGYVNQTFEEIRLERISLERQSSFSFSNLQRLFSKRAANDSNLPPPNIHRQTHK